MKIHFFTAPFYFAFIWFRIQGSRFRAFVAASPPQKEANPASLRSAAPSKGRGSRGHSLLPMEGGAPKGRRLDGGSGMKKIGGDRVKCTVYESTRAPLRGPPSPMGKAAIRGCGFSRIVKANICMCGKTIPPDTKPSPRGEGGEQSEPDRVLAA